MDNKSLTNEFVREALKGRESAFKKLYDMHKQSLLLLCLRYMNDRERAEDLLQDSFIQIFNQLHHFDPERGNFYNWAYTITVNTNLQYLRKKRITFVDLENNDAIQRSMRDDQSIIESLDLQSIVSKLQSMPTGYRTVFNLYHIEGYSHREIAEKLGISESTSKTQLMKSKYLARTILSNELEISKA
jgi:RNA polymerase sigma factor (sigma-70 family)